MIENMRGRSTETKYGRIPLWIYETGVSLQAIATYGWLHGRYGHYERVVPSYATLAKELGVSRGSVIAYVKELTRVGAVRIAVSGAAGQQTNLYEIAFNEPFEVAEKPAEGGQDSDQVVSGLYRGGQRADPGGQPVGHEEDVPKKTKKTLSPRVPQQTAPEPPAAPSNERETKHQQDDPAASIVAAYVNAAHRPVRSEIRQKIHAQALALLADGFPQAWLEDRAREMPANRWSDLAQHCDHSTVPTVRVATDSRTGWCGQCGDATYRMIKDPARDNELVECDTCHPAAVARRRRAQAGAAA